MAQENKKWVMFKSTARIPGEILGLDEDKRAQPGQPIQLPESYADHVVADGFAVESEAPKKAPKKPATKASAKSAPADPAKKKLAGMRSQLAKMAEDDPKRAALIERIADAEAAIES